MSLLRASPMLKRCHACFASQIANNKWCHVEEEALPPNLFLEVRAGVVKFYAHGYPWIFVCGQFHRKWPFCHIDIANKNASCLCDVSGYILTNK